MTRIPALILAALLFCSLPAGVSAESFLPGMPSFGGWSCAPAHKANCAAAGKLGYLGYNRGLVFDMGPSAGSLFGIITSIRHQYAVEGIWVGASARAAGPERGFAACDPGDGLCLGLGASWLFPNNKPETELFNDGILGRTWNTTTQWYTLDASASRCGWSNFSLIGGFRYDSFSTKFTDPSLLLLIPGIFSLGSPADEAELSLTSYIPYVGAETTLGPVKVGMIGFPWVPGTIQYRATLGVAIPIVPGFGGFTRAEVTGNYRNAYFFETYLEVGKQMRAVHLSAFATYAGLHATGEFDLPASLAFAIFGVQLAATDTHPYNFGIDRQNWIVGGKAVIGFNSPM